MNKQKFHLGDKVYSWQNPNKKMPVLQVRVEDEGYENKYMLRIKTEDGHSHNSKWMNESSLSKRKK